MKKIAIIGSVGIPANYGGFETFVEFLVQELNPCFEFVVFCSGPNYKNRRLEKYAGAQLRYIPLKANGLQCTPYDMWGILSAARDCDVLLILGTGGCHLLSVLRFFGLKKKVIVNIDGMEWQRTKWSRFGKWCIRSFERNAVKYADIIVGDNKVIQDYVENKYSKPCELIEYGADHCHPEPLTEELLRIYPVLNEKYIAGVCRIEPENNVHMILEAFRDFSKYPLVMIGNWNRSEYGRDLLQQYAKYSHIHLLQPIYEQKTLNAIRSNCFAYMHGHQCGGTNPSLVEAMFLKNAVFCYDVNFNRETTEHRALYFSSAQDLHQKLETLSPETVLQVQDHLYEIALRRYRWRRIAECYTDLFNR